jgi:DNA helicase-2/ATP-dependent DNA helicase PcrA
VVGTGDFTHPAWLAELQDKLVPAEPGLYRLHAGHERAIADRLPRACQRLTRFMLCVEISTIYKKGDKTRKVHHLIYAPDFESVERLNHSLGKIGNLGSDGRPILGLDSRHLLEIVLASGPGSYLVPAHIWTPWFAAMGSKSGFDSIDDCYGDLSPHIFAVETGLSSDPKMNWRVASLDRFRLVSNSDAHSPEKLGREACRFETEMDYFAMRNALETGEGYGGTVEFFPEEGKYHLDGHRACKVRLLPHETRSVDGLCPVCGKPVTVGVMHRIDSLADRDEGEDVPLETAGEMQSLVPLPEVLSEIHQVGPKSRSASSVRRSPGTRSSRRSSRLAPIPDRRFPTTPSPVRQSTAWRRRGATQARTQRRSRTHGGAPDVPSVSSGMPSSVATRHSSRSTG